MLTPTNTQEIANPEQGANRAPAAHGQTPEVAGRTIDIRAVAEPDNDALLAAVKAAYAPDQAIEVADQPKTDAGSVDKVQDPAGYARVANAVGVRLNIIRGVLQQTARTGS